MKAVLKNNVIEVYDAYHVKDTLKTIYGCRWNPDKKAWILPMTVETVEQLKNVPGEIDIAVLEKYETLKKIQSRVLQQKEAEQVLPIEPMPLKAYVKPYQHQIKGYNIVGELLEIFNASADSSAGRGAALLMEMGCGKTLVAVAVAGRAFLNGKINKLLVVCPTSVMSVWQQELDKIADFPFMCVLLEGAVEKRKETLLNLTDVHEKLLIVVMNYEATWRMQDELVEWGPDMVIADESQRIKNPTAKQSKAMHELGKRAKYKLILTGTPVQNQPLDFFSQYKFLDKTIFGTSYYTFRDRYAVLGGYGNMQVVRYKNLDELVRKAHSIAYRVTKEEALDLPEQIDQYQYCVLEPEAARFYNELKNQSYAEIESKKEITANNILTQLLRLQQIAGGFITTDAGETKQISNAKLNLLADVISDILDAGKKVVVFARFLVEIKAIMDLLDDMSIKYSFITGEVPPEKRSEQIKHFQEDPEYKVFVAQIQTAGLGITLHAADIAVFYSLDFNYANYIQARARIHRIGQQNKCTFVHLLARGTVDEYVLEALQRKENLAKTIVDNWRMYFR